MGPAIIISYTFLIIGGHTYRGLKSILNIELDSSIGEFINLSGRKFFKVSDAFIRIANQWLLVGVRGVALQQAVDGNKIFDWRVSRKVIED